jgi:hypothetical protein
VDLPIVLMVIFPSVYPLVMTNITMENHHRNSELSHEKWWIFHRNSGFAHEKWWNFP